MAKVKFVGLTVSLFLVACGNSGSKTAANSAQASGSEQSVAQNGVSSNVQNEEQDAMDYEDSYADAE